MAASDVGIFLFSLDRLMCLEPIKLMAIKTLDL